MDESEFQLQELKSSNILWNRQPLDNEKILEPRTIMEILWDLSELNFRFELTALDDHLCSEEHLISLGQLSPQYLSILQCFSGDGRRFILAPLVSQANEGLAALTLRSRIPYLLALRKVMSAWQGVDGSQLMPEIHDDGWEDKCEDDLKKFEHLLACVYSTAFYKVFGRPPIVPHGLV